MNDRGIYVKPFYDTDHNDFALQGYRSPSKTNENVMRCPSNEVFMVSPRCCLKTGFLGHLFVDCFDETALFVSSLLLFAIYF